jgi:malonyl-CoA O-methyltransferase
LNKQQIAKAFGRKASDYDTHARVQKYVGSILLDKLQAQEGIPSGVLLDLGTGSGFFLPKLKQAFVNHSIIAADLSEGMIRHASVEHTNSLQAGVVADAELLPFKDNSLSIVYSSMAIQWCEDIEQLFSGLSRVVKPGGVIAFSTLLPNTLSELKDAWHGVDQRTHVNRFLPETLVVEAMSKHGTVLFKGSERVVAGYSDLKSMLHSIKGIGANTVTHGSRAMTKTQFKRLEAEYEKFRDGSGNLPASYDVLYGVIRIEG